MKIRPSALRLAMAICLACVLALTANADAPQPEPQRIGDSITNSLGMKLVYIPAGEFTMSNGVLFDSAPPHHVTITKPYLMSSTEVTQAQWTKLMGVNHSEFRGDDLPVDNVSWDDAVAFCKRLSEKEGRKYRLPTQAEWEYACHAGTRTEYYTGEGTAALKKAGWYDSNSKGKTHPVGEKAPNDWGLYDMHGNLWEWVSDWHGPIENAPAVDPKGPERGTRRVMCGGSYNHPSFRCRAWDRDKEEPDHADDDIGFRVVCELSEPETRPTR